MKICFIFASNILLLMTFIGCVQNSQVDDVREIEAFITNNISNTVRYNPQDSALNIGLPLPYSVPCEQNTFQEMYYWDTYFTNIGLIEIGQIDQAKNNVDNILFLIDKFGYMPNGSHKLLLNRSQPPYASMMVRDIYEKTKNKNWLVFAVKYLEREYSEFWMKKRIAPNGLNMYSNDATEQECLDFYYMLLERFPDFVTQKVVSDEQRIEIGSHYIAEAESGWDFTPRFGGKAQNYVPLDLNSNLYLYEKNFEYFYSELDWAGADIWSKKAETRKELFNKYCYNEKEGLFYDYDFVNNEHSNIMSSAVFNVLWSGLATEKQAEEIVSHLDRLEFDYGLSACEPGNRGLEFQWDYPNGWASNHYLAIEGLDKYGFKNDAERIARKYTQTIVDNFKITQNLWEKYNVAEGNLDVNEEYEMPPFLGWTAGVFLYASDYAGLR